MESKRVFFVAHLARMKLLFFKTILNFIAGANWKGAKLGVSIKYHHSTPLKFFTPGTYPKNEGFASDDFPFQRDDFQVPCFKERFEAKPEVSIGISQGRRRIWLYLTVYS